MSNRQVKWPEYTITALTEDVYRCVTCACARAPSQGVAWQGNA